MNITLEKSKKPSIDRGVLRAGIDVGSTTAKIALLDGNNECVFSQYVRHNTEVDGTLLNILLELYRDYGNIPLKTMITGSAGMGISESMGLPFIQEVIGSTQFMNWFYPDADMFVDIGGEDSKVVFFDERRRPGMRMNGSCAGGTGAFIDQMGVLLDLSIEEMDNMAGKHRKIYPMASRCGVFAKTDVQNLLSKQIPREDIAASIFHAVALQTATALLQGLEVRPKIVFSGGPLYFINNLRKSLINVLGVAEDDIVLPDRPELTPAIGAALCGYSEGLSISLGELIGLIESRKRSTAKNSTTILEPLFHDTKQCERWEKRFSQYRIEEADLEDLHGRRSFIGIDSGSTTTKIVLIDEEGRLAFRYYAANGGDPVGAVKRGLQQLGLIISEKNVKISIAGTAVTGYGEDLIRTAFSLDEGIVETVAHYRAAHFFNKDVSFILDIGGQDMKAIFIKDGVVNHIEINEACSSGCGSFIQTFASSLNMEVADFARAACESKHPYDLGTRCTVFMNSKIKQCLREGTAIEDISAGLAYSVIRNCFNKVLKIHDTSVLGENIVVQGGTFKNPAVLRAAEKFLGRDVIRPEICELMGAYGCALSARDGAMKYPEKTSIFPGLEDLEQACTCDARTILCGGCENKCTIAVMKFSGNRKFYTGNRCENIYSNSGSITAKGTDLTAIKNRLLFERPMKPSGIPLSVVGIPRALNLYDSFPFWCTLLVESGIEVVLSETSSNAMIERGASTVMSENICFPAKAVHGHIINLIDRGVDRILYPLVRFEKGQFKGTLNTFNCPVVAGYPDVIRNSINPSAKDIPFDSPLIVFNDDDLLKKTCWTYLEERGVSYKTFKKAFRRAQYEQNEFRRSVLLEGQHIIENARSENRLVILLAGRPYHCDPLINHGIPSLITAFGADVITEDAIPVSDIEFKKNVHVLTQWEYPNRIYNSSHWAGSEDNVQIIQLNSFGCGPDAVVVDEARSILETYGKALTVLRIDEIESNGSVKLRIRSMIESLKNFAGGDKIELSGLRDSTPPYLEKDRQKTIIAPCFSPHLSLLIKAFFGNAGYNVNILPEPDRESVELALKYVNNEICYPAIICIGDILKALRSGRYDPENTVAAITATGGQCRASNYVPLLKKAMVKAGYGDVPVLAVTMSPADMNEQSGFKLPPLSSVMMGFSCLLFVEAIQRLYYAAAVREKKRGNAQAVADKYLKTASESMGRFSLEDTGSLLHRAVDDFNRIEGVDSGKVFPRVGIVGEIYVKHNPFGNSNIAQWLTENGIEVSVPGIIGMFLEKFVNIHFNHVNNIVRSGLLSRKLLRQAEKLAGIRIQKTNRILERALFPVDHIPEMHQVAEKAEGIVSLMHQYGEGWMLPGEAALMASEGINNIVCVQPFGCIANHIIAKGMSRRIKDLYPDINILFLDMDADGSEANIFNRLQFLIKNARDDAQETT